MNSSHVKIINIENYEKKAKEIFRILNNFRTNPSAFIKHLEMLRCYLDTNTKILSEPGKIQIQMVEGEQVIIDAIKYLRNLPKLSPLEWDENLTLSAIEHVMDIGPKGLLSYESSDGTEPEDRICKYGQYIESLGENIEFGPNDALGVIVSLTLDDGEIDRPHRENLFKSDYSKVGIACGPHKTEYEMCVMDFAYDFVKKELEVGTDKTATPKLNKDGLEHSPLVRISLDKDEGECDDECLVDKVKQLNKSKKVILKFVEVTTKVVYTYSDGGTKEVIEVQNHTFNY
jgi:uncharacterized protein YkwD